MLLNGLSITHYSLEQRIGDGGMSEVYLARDTRLQRAVALKIVRTAFFPDSDDDELREACRLFQREARAVSMLDHPHILPLFDYGETVMDDITLTYLVMPYHAAGSLENWLRKQQTRQLHPLVVEHVIDQAAAALQYAHDRGIVHQDVKLSNFLVTPNPVLPEQPDILLADFGVARVYSAEMTSSRNIRGTPVAMAPEQWSGETQPASDQYALAIMAYRLLTGHYPFEGEPMQIMYQHLEKPPLPPSQIVALSDHIDNVLLQALQKDPHARFPHIADFARSLHEAIHASFLPGSGALQTGARSTDPQSPVSSIPHIDICENETPRWQPGNGGQDVLTASSQSTPASAQAIFISHPLTPLPDIAPEAIQALLDSSKVAAIQPARTGTEIMDEASSHQKPIVMPDGAIKQATELAHPPEAPAFSRERVPQALSRHWLGKKQILLLIVAIVLVLSASLMLFLLTELGKADEQTFSQGKTTPVIGNSGQARAHTIQATSTPQPQETIQATQNVIDGLTPTATAQDTQKSTGQTPTLPAGTPTTTVQNTSGATATPTTPASTPTAGQTVALSIQTIALVVNPTVANSCGSPVTVTYTATLTNVAKSAGGTVTYSYTVDNGQTFQTGSVDFAAGDVTQQVVFTGIAQTPGKSGHVKADGAHTAWLSTTDPDTVSSPKVTPSASCS